MEQSLQKHMSTMSLEIFYEVTLKMEKRIISNWRTCSKQKHMSTLSLEIFYKVTLKNGEKDHQ